MKNLPGEVDTESTPSSSSSSSVKSNYPANFTPTLIQGDMRPYFNFVEGDCNPDYDMRPWLATEEHGDIQ